MSEYDEIWQENISALLDGELSEQQTRAMRAAVETGEEPRAVFAAFSALENALPDAFPEVPAGLHEHILSGVRAAASRQTSHETNAPRRTGRRLSPRRLRAAVIAAACLALIITGVSLSGRFFRMGRSGSGAAYDTASVTQTSDSAGAADAGGGAYILHEGAATTEAAEEEEYEGPTADAPAAADDTAFDSAAGKVSDPSEGFASLTVLADGRTYEGEDAAAVVDDFFDDGPSDKRLLLTVTFPDGGVYSVQLWYRGDMAVCILNEDGVEVESLEEILAYFRG